MSGDSAVIDRLGAREDTDMANDGTAEDATPADEAPTPAGKITNAFAAIVPAGVGVFFAIASAGLGLGSLAEPGPGLWPFTLSLVMIGASLALLIAGPRRHGAESFTRTSWIVCLALVTVAGFLLALPIVGFEVPTAGLIFIWLYVIGREPLWLSGLLAIVMTVCFSLLFVVALGVPLPRLF